MLEMLVHVLMQTAITFKILRIISDFKQKKIVRVDAKKINYFKGSGQLFYFLRLRRRALAKISQSS